MHRKSNQLLKYVNNDIIHTTTRQKQFPGVISHLSLLISILPANENMTIDAFYPDRTNDFKERDLVTSNFKFNFSRNSFDK